MNNVDSSGSFRVPEAILVHIAADRIGCSERTVRRLIQKGVLPAQRRGERQWEILRTDADLIRRRREKLW
jgi:excisionase family DNA binding protein